MKKFLERPSDASLELLSVEEINGVQVVTRKRETPDGVFTTSEGLVEAMSVPYTGLTPEEVTAKIRERYEAIVNSHREALAHLVS